MKIQRKDETIKGVITFLEDSLIAYNKLYFEGGDFQNCFLGLSHDEKTGEIITFVIGHADQLMWALCIMMEKDEAFFDLLRDAVMEQNLKTLSKMTGKEELTDLLRKIINKK